MSFQNTYPSGTILLAVGTSSGLFLVSSQDRKHWKIEETSLRNASVYHALFDARNHYRLFAGDNSASPEPVLCYSDDFGQTWQEPERGLTFPAAYNLQVKNIWLIEPGRATEPGTLYAGTDPACLWISTDGGETWEVNREMLEHPTYSEWQPGAGGLCLNSILPDPNNHERMWVAISSVGCLRTEDSGKHWAFANKNMKASYMAPPYPEAGYCIHSMIQHPQQSGVLYQQHHGGLYKSNNGGEYWVEMTNNLPCDFGFPIAMDVNHPDTLYCAVITEQGRYNYNNQFTIYRSDNAGEHWEELTEGLPGGEGVRLGVLRHGLCTDTLDPCGVYVGTNTGQLFGSSNRGDQWQQIADYLPRINSVTAMVIQ